MDVFVCLFGVGGLVGWFCVCCLVFFVFPSSCPPLFGMLHVPSTVLLAVSYQTSMCGDRAQDQHLHLNSDLHFLFGLLIEIQLNLQDFSNKKEVEATFCT